MIALAFCQEPLFQMVVQNSFTVSTSHKQRSEFREAEMTGIYGAERGKNYEEGAPGFTGWPEFIAENQAMNTSGKTPRGYAKKYWESVVNSPRAYTEIQDSIDPAGKLISLDTQGDSRGPRRVIS